MDFFLASALGCLGRGRVAGLWGGDGTKPLSEFCSHRPMRKSGMPFSRFVPLFTIFFPCFPFFNIFPPFFPIFPVFLYFSLFFPLGKLNLGPISQGMHQPVLLPSCLGMPSTPAKDVTAPGSYHSHSRGSSDTEAAPRHEPSSSSPKTKPAHPGGGVCVCVRIRPLHPVKQLWDTPPPLPAATGCPKAASSGVFNSVELPSLIFGRKKKRFF